MTHFLCLAAIFNHRQEWTENLVELFLRQEYEDNALLLLIDDRSPSAQMPTFAQVRGRNTVYSIHHSTRFPTLMQKYDWGKEVGIGLGAYGYCCVMDDDDVYLPNFLASHAEVLSTGKAWSYPEHIWSTYTMEVKQEPTGNRFWASSAYTLNAIRDIGGYGDTPKAGFDQMFLSRMREKHGEPGKPSTQYVYNWGLTYDSHTSGHMKSFDDTTWYSETKESPATGPLSPKLSASTIEVFEKLGYKA